jgi:hypothetical protein
MEQPVVFSALADDDDFNVDAGIGCAGLIALFVAAVIVIGGIDHHGWKRIVAFFAAPIIFVVVGRLTFVGLRRWAESQGPLPPIEDTSTAERRRRQPIPESVRHEVWRRDEGRCVDCGSRERLEFDHIIPLSRGGSNTARNVELRCEVCNRKKGAKI